MQPLIACTANIMRRLIEERQRSTAKELFTASKLPQSGAASSSSSHPAGGVTSTAAASTSTASAAAPASLVGMPKRLSGGESVISGVGKGSVATARDGAVRARKVETSLVVQLHEVDTFYESTMDLLAMVQSYLEVRPHVVLSFSVYVFLTVFRFPISFSISPSVHSSTHPSVHLLVLLRSLA